MVSVSKKPDPPLPIHRLLRKLNGLWSRFHTISRLAMFFSGGSQMPELLVPGSAQVLHWCSILCHSTPIRSSVFLWCCDTGRMVSDSEPVPLLLVRATQPLLSLTASQRDSRISSISFHHRNAGTRILILSMLS